MRWAMSIRRWRQRKGWSSCCKGFAMPLFAINFDKVFRQSWQQTGWYFGLFLWEYI